MQVEFLYPEVEIQSPDLGQIIIVQPQNLQILESLKFLQDFDPTSPEMHFYGFLGLFHVFKRDDIEGVTHVCLSVLLLSSFYR